MTAVVGARTRPDNDDKMKVDTFDDDFVTGLHS